MSFSHCLLASICLTQTCTCLVSSPLKYMTFTGTGSSSLNAQYVISAANGLSIRTKNNVSIVGSWEFMGMKICRLTQAEMFTGMVTLKTLYSCYVYSSSTTAFLTCILARIPSNKRLIEIHHYPK